MGITLTKKKRGTQSLLPPGKADWRKVRQSGKALYSWRRAIGMNRVTFAGLANCSERSLASYEKTARFPAQVRPQMTEALRLVGALLDIIPAGELRKWLQTPNPGFGGQKPWTLIKKGERDVIWEMIHQTRLGAFA